MNMYASQILGRLYKFTYKAIVFSNLILAECNSKNSEMPRVHASGFPETYGFEEELFLIGHRWLPYFSEHTGQAECVRVQSKTPIKLNRSKKSSLRTIPRKEWSRKNIHKHFWLRKLWRKNKQKVYRRELEAIRVWASLYLWENLPTLL